MVVAACHGEAETWSSKTASCWGGRACWPVGLRVRCVGDVVALYTRTGRCTQGPRASVAGDSQLVRLTCRPWLAMSLVDEYDGNVSRLARWSGCVADNGCGVEVAHGPANGMT
jgi:hypothetical protein